MSLFNKNAKKNSNESDRLIKTSTGSESFTNKSNFYMLGISIVLVGVFIACVVFMDKSKRVVPASTQDIENTEKKVETAVVAAAPIDIKQKITAPVISLPPQLNLDKTSIDMTNTEVGKQIEDTITLNVENAPIKITSIDLSSKNTDGFNVSDTCIDKDKLENSNDFCTISLEWVPEKEITKNFSMIVKWESILPGSDGKIIKKNVKVDIALSSFLPTPPPAPVEEVKPEPVKVEEVVDKPVVEAPVKEVFDTNCRKFSAKAFDFTGSFLGWAQINKEVYSPDCVKVIGTLKENGDIIENGTGKIIGKGPSALGAGGDLADRASQKIPDDLSAYFDDSQNEKEKKDIWAEAMANRAAAKASPAAEKDHKVSDPASVLKASKLFAYKGGAVKSSYPINSKFLLRANKPIPAVLNRAISTSRLEDGQPVSATVERNVYGGDGRIIVLPAGTQVWGKFSSDGFGRDDQGATGKDQNRGAENNKAQSFTSAYDKKQIKWTKFIRPDGAEFDLTSAGATSYSGDAQGRAGIAGKRDTGYIESVIITPFLTALLPAMVQMIGPKTADTTDVVNSTGTLLRTSTTAANMAKDTFIKAFTPAMEQLINQSLANTIDPGLVIPAGTRITIFVDKGISVCWDPDDDTCWQNDSTE